MLGSAGEAAWKHALTDECSNITSVSLPSALDTSETTEAENCREIGLFNVDQRGRNLTWNLSEK